MVWIDKGRAMAGRQVPWQRVPFPVDEARVVAPTGLNVRLGAGVRHRSEGRRRAGAPTPLQAAPLPYTLLATWPQGLVSTSEEAPRSCTRLTVAATSLEDRGRHRPREPIR